jgi:rubrerythrin
MGSLFEASDIFEIAMRIEENGSNFYRFAVQLAKDEDAKKMFSHLAEEEDKHKAIFKGMLSKIETHYPPENYPDEYGTYLRNYADNNLIFKKEALDKELAGITDTLSAIDFAIRRELDSILYYHEIKGFVPGGEHGSIDKIINEERKHFNLLSEIRQKYA